MEKVSKKTTGAKKVTTDKKIIAKTKPIKSEKIVVADSVQSEPTVKVDVSSKKSITLNQEFNLVVGFISLLTIIALCFEFNAGEISVSGWELFVYGSKLVSGAFQGLMIVYVLALVIDCVMAICVDSENPTFDIVEKALYMFTIVINFIVIATLLCVISKIGVGLIILFILSIVSVIVKFARIYSAK